MEPAHTAAEKFPSEENLSGNFGIGDDSNAPRLGRPAQETFSQPAEGRLHTFCAG